MKFGRNFSQRSVPEWWTHNIDYDNVKNLIKTHTTSPSEEAAARPIAVRGAPSADHEQDWSDELFEELRSQYEIANDFVHVKKGEVERRLADVRRRVSKLVLRAESAVKRPSQRRQYGKAMAMEAEIHEIGDEIRKLTQFTDANVKACGKLLKKYEKWTGSRTLSSRFRRCVVTQQASLFNCDCESLFWEYSAVLEASREAVDLFKGSARPPSESGKTVKSLEQTSRDAVAKKLHAACDGNVREFDEDFATLPVSDKGRQMTYWVHDDNLLSIQILLLRFALPQKRRKPQGEAGIEPISSLTSRSSTSLRASSKDAPCANCLSIVDVDDSLASKLSVLRLTKQDLKEPPEVRDWLATRNGFDPVPIAEFHRQRYFGLLNASTGGLYVTIDSNIRSRSVTRQFLIDGEATLDIQNEGVRFPHNVLQIRLEGAYSDTLLNTFQESHLVHSAPSFSLEAYATHSTHGGRNLPWLKELDKDIRKVSSQERSGQMRRAAGKARIRREQSSQASTLTEGSTGVFSAINGQSSATSIQEDPSYQVGPESNARPIKQSWPKEGLSRKSGGKKVATSIDDEDPSYQRYWNEYDDDSDDNENHRYVVYTRSEAPGASSFSTGLTEICQKSVRQAKGLATGFAKTFHLQKSSSGEKKTLLSEEFSSEETDQSDDGSSTVRPARSYGSISPGSEDCRSDQWRNFFQWISLISLFLGIGALTGGLILFVTERDDVARSPHTISMIWTVVLVLLSFTCAGLGAGFAFAQSPPQSRAYRVTFLFFDILIFVFGLALLAAASKFL